MANTPFQESRARFSPDGKWIAYTSNKSGQNEVYLQDFPAVGRSIQVSLQGGDHPAWRADGRELYFISGTKFIAVPVEATLPDLRLGHPAPLFDLPMGAFGESYSRYRFAVAKNGREFYVSRQISPRTDSPIHIMMNATPNLEAAKR